MGAAEPREGPETTDVGRVAARKAGMAIRVRSHGLERDMFITSCMVHDARRSRDADSD